VAIQKRTQHHCEIVTHWHNPGGGFNQDCVHPVGGAAAGAAGAGEAGAAGAAGGGEAAC
jgi:hypothetical protein